MVCSHVNKVHTADPVKDMGAQPIFFFFFLQKKFKLTVAVTLHVYCTELQLDQIRTGTGK